MVLLMFSMPFAVVAQQDAVQAAADATADANKAVNKTLWFGAGCVLSGVSFSVPYGYILAIGGIAGSYFYNPAPPPHRLLGKSPEYIATYTSTYKSKRGMGQATWTTIGCVSGSTVIAVALVGLIIAVYSEEE